MYLHIYWILWDFCSQILKDRDKSWSLRFIFVFSFFFLKLTLYNFSIIWMTMMLYSFGRTEYLRYYWSCNYLKKVSWTCYFSIFIKGNGGDRKGPFQLYEEGNVMGEHVSTSRDKSKIPSFKRLWHRLETIREIREYRIEHIGSRKSIDDSFRIPFKSGKMDFVRQF